MDDGEGFFARFVEESFGKPRLATAVAWGDDDVIAQAREEGVGGSAKMGVVVLGVGVVEEDDGVLGRDMAWVAFGNFGKGFFGDVGEWAVGGDPQVL